MVNLAGPHEKPDPGELLAWYDRHRRRLPWRAEAGEVADPYRVWLSEIMLQQTTAAAVKPFYEAFLRRFPTVEALAGAEPEAVMQAWAGLGYYSRARNLHRAAQAVVEEHGGRFPATEAALRRLPGVGAYTAGAVAAIAFGERAAAVDGNVERVFARVYRLEDPPAKARRALHELVLALVPAERPGDFAQALMDLGATICTPRRPACALCPWMLPCGARADGRQEEYPRKVEKRVGALRRGAAFVATRADGTVLLRTRPPEGLLGGMAEVPTSDWVSDYDLSRAMLDAPLDARWTRLPGQVRHVFTHFPLELTVFLARVSSGVEAPDGMRWTPRDKLAEEALPGAMRKVLAHALAPPVSGKAKAAGSKAERKPGISAQAAPRPEAGALLDLAAAPAARPPTRFKATPAPGPATRATAGPVAEPDLDQAVEPEAEPRPRARPRSRARPGKPRG